MRGGFVEVRRRFGAKSGWSCPPLGQKGPTLGWNRPDAGWVGANRATKEFTTPCQIYLRTNTLVLPHGPTTYSIGQWWMSARRQAESNLVWPTSVTWGRFGPETSTMFAKRYSNFANRFSSLRARKRPGAPPIPCGLAHPPTPIRTTARQRETRGRDGEACTSRPACSGETETKSALSTWPCRPVDNLDNKSGLSPRLWLDNPTTTSRRRPLPANFGNRGA